MRLRGHRAYAVVGKLESRDVRWNIELREVGFKGRQRGEVTGYEIRRRIGRGHADEVIARIGVNHVRGCAGRRATTSPASSIAGIWVPGRARRFPDRR